MLQEDRVRFNVCTGERFTKLKDDFLRKCKDLLATEYSFKIQNIEMLNFDEIEKELTKKNPVICISFNKRRFVIVHRNILQKANILQIKPPKNWKRYGASSQSMIHELMPTTFNDEVKASTFKRSLIWIRKVQKAEWLDKKNPVTVTVTLPKL